MNLSGVGGDPCKDAFQIKERGARAEIKYAVNNKKKTCWRNHGPEKKRRRACIGVSAYKKYFSILSNDFKSIE